jgi:hypothetical protein
MARKDRINLLIDHDAVERARRYSARHGTSISRIVSDFLASLPLEEEREIAQLSPTVRRLIGVACGTDVDVYRAYLSEKYGS